MIQKPTATILIRDEVNCKIQNVDTQTRRELVKKFSYILPHARHTPAYKLGRWDGKVGFFQLGGSTYINLLEEIIPVLLNKGYEIELDDRRDYKRTFEFIKINENSFFHITWPGGHPKAGQPIILREHQVNVIDNFLMNLQSVQAVATGAGKTIIVAALSHIVEPYGRSIIIVPNKSLVEQTEEDYVNMNLDVGVFYGNRKEYTKTHTICTWQSLNSLYKKTKKGEAPIDINEFLDGVVCVIVDECFDGDTLITTPNGKAKIKDIKPGDTIINLSEETKQYKEDTVVKVHKNLTNSQTEAMLELQFDNDTIIRVTANHKFLTDVGWVRADKLTNEMEIIDINTYTTI